MKIKHYLILTAFLCVAIASCKSKKGSSGISDEQSSQLDERFQTVYFEGIKQRAIENYENAYNSFEECLGLKPQEDAVFYELAKLDTLNSDFAKALGHINSAVNLAPNNLWYARFQASTLLELGQISDAVKVLESVSKRDPEDIKTRTSLLNIALNQNNTSEAVQLITSLEEIEGKSYEYSSQKYNLLISEGKSSAALEELKALSAIQPFNLECQRAIATHYANEGQPDLASQAYLKILELEPGDGNTHLALADFYLDQNNEDALSHLQSGFSDETADASLKLKLIQKLSASTTISDYETEAFLLEQLRSLYPDMSGTWKMSAMHVKESDPNQSLAYLAKSVELNPNDSKNWLDLISFAQSIDLLKAEEYSMEALELFPMLPELYLARGEVLNESTKYTLAANVLKNGLNISVNENSTFLLKNELILSYFLSSDYEMAQNWLSQIINKLETGFDLELAGDVYAKTGDMQSALSYWKQALETGSGSSILEEKITNEKYIEK